MRLSIATFALLLLCSCGDHHRHLRCFDEKGNEVVNTTDLKSTPDQYETAWIWRNSDRTEYTEISVPPHKCVYNRYDIDPENPDAKFSCDVEKPQPQQFLADALD